MRRRFDFYAKRIYQDKKRTNLWQLTIGLISTGKGQTITTEELEKLEEQGIYKIKRIHKRAK
jgi:hypothetical protein